MSQSGTSRFAKRTLDVTVSAAAIVVTLPVMVGLLAISALALRTWSPLFVHQRVGQGGRSFPFVKIRTLPSGVGSYRDKGDIDPGSIPRVMRLIRRSHLDELPQLLLVLVGSMSLVGPRPEMPQLHSRLPPDFAVERTSVRPGLTGLWQIGPHCTGGIGDRPEYDLAYLRHGSLLLDVWILWATIAKVLMVRTSSLGSVPSWAWRSVPPSVVAAPVAEPADATGRLAPSGWREA